MDDPLLPTSLDYAALRQEGLRQLERLSGAPWTDFNTHDPGITLLEQLCYALADLGYRTAHDVPDLLAEAGADPYQNLPLPAPILTCNPVTLADLRRVALDVTGVHNAWIEPFEDDHSTLYYHAEQSSLSLSPAPLPSEPVKLKGLYRVLIDRAEGASSDLRARVALRLHRCRALCEDFAEITVLEPQNIRVEATVEIGAVDDTGELERAIVRKIADVIAPPVPFRTLEDGLRAGVPLDAMFEGPRLDHGFLTDDVLARATRRVAINSSDIVHAIRDLPEVQAVSGVRLSIMSSDGRRVERSDRWSLPITPGKVAKLDRVFSSIVLRRGGQVVSRTTRQTLAPATPLAAATVGDPALPAGRDRHLIRYTSVQQHLPAIYGVGDLGLPDSASPERKAQANQLRAYLMFFDQIMANHLAQLAHVKDLFSYEGSEAATYFSQAVQQPGAATDPIRTGRDDQDILTSSLAAGRAGAALALDVERRNRFFNHLLARFAETLDDHGTSSTEALVSRKQEFLQRYLYLGAVRGAAVDYLDPASPGARTALEQRIAFKLGLTEEELPIVVEHILLRPVLEDGAQDVPLVAASRSAALDSRPLPPSKDPYSLQLTFVFPPAGRFDLEFGDRRFQSLVEQTIREETPPHLTAYVSWYERNWGEFRKVHEAWIERRREYWTDQLGVPREELTR